MKSPASGLPLRTSVFYRAVFFSLKKSLAVIMGLAVLLPATPRTFAACVTATANGTWQTAAITAQAGTFTVAFDATPSASPTNAVVGLSKGVQTAFSGFATIARFNPSGAIDARNGGAYAAASTIPYTAGATYHFRLVINIAAHSYSIFVTPPGGAELTVGSNYAFRTEQNAVTSLDHWGVEEDASVTGSVAVCNFALSGSTPVPDFLLTASPAAVTVAAGSATSDTATVGALNGFTGAVALSVSGLPGGATGTFSPTSITTAGNATLTVTTTSATAAGTYTLTVTGKSGSLTHSATVSLTVNTNTATKTITLTLNPAKARATAIPADFAGLSYEIQVTRFNFLTPNAYWLASTNTPYVTMLKTIGVKNVRIGGNTTERNTTADAYPSDADGAQVNNFINAVGATLIWCVPVADKFDPVFYSGYGLRLIDDQQSKGYALKTVFEIGNEPDGWDVSQPVWQTRFDAYSAAFDTSLGASVLYCGPSCASDQSYAAKLSSDAMYQGALHSHIAYITQHWYPFGGSSSYANAAAAIDTMLSSTNGTKYQNFYNGWGKNAETGGFAPRMEETNSIFEGGLAGASDSLGAALWALDYLSYFAQNTNLVGINFHVANVASAYNAISPVGLASSYTLHGVGYGLLAFAQNSQGQPVPCTISNPGNINLTAYANLRTDGTETIHLINKSHTTTSVDATVVVNPGKTFAHAEVMYLSAPNNDPTATTGITLGGQPVSGNGTWTGTFTQILTPTNGTFTISIPRTQAAIVHFY